MAANAMLLVSIVLEAAVAFIAVLAARTIAKLRVEEGREAPCFQRATCETAAARGIFRLNEG